MTKKEADAACIIAMGMMKDDSSIPHSLKTSSSDEDRDSVTSLSESVGGEGGCLKHKTQFASLRHVYKANNSNSEKKLVRFDSIRISSHAIILGDNPAVSKGPPVTIEWKSFESMRVSVDDYEVGKGTCTDDTALCTGTTRRGFAMILPLDVREDMLRAAGYARSEWVAVVRETSRIRQSRAASAHQAALARDRLRWRNYISMSIPGRSNRPTVAAAAAAIPAR